MEENGLFDVLGLFAEAFEFGLEGDDGVGDFGVVGLGADGVDFAAELLGEEVEGAAGSGGGNAEC